MSLNTKQLKEKFEKKFTKHKLFAKGAWGYETDDVWSFIESEIITPYEKQLEQVERELLNELRKDFIEESDCIASVKRAFKRLSKSQNTQTK